MNHEVAFQTASALAPERLRNYVVGLRDACWPEAWIDVKPDSIMNAWGVYENGDAELCQGRVKNGEREWVILYMIPRKRKREI